MVSLIVASMVIAPAALAAGNAPQGGKGLTYLVGDHHFSSPDCPTDDTITDILVSGGIAVWVVGDTDAHYVLQSMSEEFIRTYPDESYEVYSSTRTFGKKSGKGEAVTCTADFSETHDGVSEEGQITFSMVRIW
jgi:hypothetical protein